MVLQVRRLVKAHGSLRGKELEHRAQHYFILISAQSME